MRTVMTELVTIETRDSSGKPRSWVTNTETTLALAPGEKVVNSHIVNANDNVYIVYVIKEGINLIWMWTFLPFILLSLLVYLKYKYHF